ncbi:MAG: integration host factor subunit beta [Planctomycetes bacterium]|nr:integration host factor subunit beta [Planctomycetota bacterium]
MSNRTVTKREICETIAEETGNPQIVAKEIVQCFLDRVIDELADGNRLEFRNFGVFEIRLQPARKARNPRTNEVVHVDPKAVVTFKVGKEMGEKAQQALPYLQKKQRGE